MLDQHLTGLLKIRTKFINAHSSKKFIVGFIGATVCLDLVCLEDRHAEFVDRIGTKGASSIEMTGATAYIAQFVA